MEPWVTWAIVLGIGLVVGFAVHAFIRLAQGSSTFTTVLAGILGAAAAAWYVAPYMHEYLGTTSLLVSRFVWAAIGAAVVSMIVEALFVGSKRGRVITT